MLAADVLLVSMLALCIQKSTLVDSNNFITRSSVNFTRFYQGRQQSPFRAPPNPLAIFLPLTEVEISVAVKCAYRYNVPVVPRSGGHSYEGFSALDDALVLDLAGYRQVSVTSKKLGLVIVQSGARLGHVYEELWNKAQLTFNAGTCPTVGIGGHIAGGGYGMLARSKGLAADRVSKMRIALYDGSIIEATENNEHKDLWWALRGGGGGTFGIVTEFTIQAFSPEPVNTMFALFWEIGAARDLMTAWMAYFPSSDSRLVTQFNFYTDQVFLVGQFLGSKSELEIILSKSQMLGNNFNTNQFLINSTITEDCNALESKAFMWTFNCNSTDFITNSSSEIYRPETDVDHHKYKSEYFDTLPSNQDIENIISSIASAPNGSWLQLEALGGVFQNTSNSYTPYWHRQGVLFSMQYAAPMNSSDLSGLNWITKFELLLKDITNGHHYYNYIDRDLGSAVQAGLAYFGEDNFKRLVNVKRKYDPNNVFKNPQSIPVMI